MRHGPAAAMIASRVAARLRLRLQEDALSVIDAVPAVANSTTNLDVARQECDCSLPDSHQQGVCEVQLSEEWVWREGRVEQRHATDALSGQPWQAPLHVDGCDSTDTQYNTVVLWRPPLKP